ncbi:C-C motif chemokine 15-like [Artibeus jamaicensis]|uniref:C-C motif chemokine 15-like n=1 Tax=Artibeus jamaicensis TaxID=9417 RepID=UPI00235B1599|nr:C-C motif chemokine 15-like [Artibeus jamaicensis]
MKVSAAILPFLILAAALGRLARGSPARELGSAMHEQDDSRIQHAGVHRPTDCCSSYTTRRIRCKIMKDYFLTTIGCSQAAVIFKTRGGQEVCFHPGAEGVQECITKLASANTEKTAGEKKLY